MGFDNRKLLLGDAFNRNYMACESNCNLILNPDGWCLKSCFDFCPAICKRIVLPVNDLPPPFLPSPPPPSPPPPPPRIEFQNEGILNQKHIISTSLTIMAGIIGGALIFSIFCAIMRLYFLKRRNLRRRNAPIIFATQDDFLDEDRWPSMDHHVWYINTVGLPQSVIDSITVFKFQKREGLIEGTECSVCLGEFEEDESLRLLPKCSHAFHISCIDTWLSSHKTCPLCRAPIVSEAILVQANATEQHNSNSPSPIEETEVENLDNNHGDLMGDDEAGEIGISEVRIEDDNLGSLPIEGENSTKENLGISRTRNCDSGCRVLSDLGETRRLIGEEMQPIRRSVSLDSSTALMIYNAMASFNPNKHQENLVELKRLNSNSKTGSKRFGRGSSSLCRLVKSSSIGRSLQKGPVSMKRSFSSAGKPSSSRNCQSYDSVLPL